MFWLVFTISEWVIRLVMLPVVTRRRKPDAAMAWLLMIFFLPWAGLILFLILGTVQFPGSRRRRAAKMYAKIETEAQRFRGHPNVVRPDLGPQLETTIQVAERLGNFPILSGNQATFLAETDEFINRLVEDIDNARNHVHLLFYIFRDDETGMRVIDALSRAVKRGVRCRVLVDDVGSRKSLRSLLPRMHAADIDIYSMLPVGIFRRRMARIDMRNHRKLAVIDGAIGYTGSQNIVNANYGHKDLAWHDIMVRLTGPITIELQAIFVTDWHQESREILTGPDIFVEPVLAGDVPAQTLPSGPIFPVENYQRLVVSALHGAHRRVIITTPYFVPDEPLLQAIQIAVWRGVTIDLIVPQRCDQVIVGAAARAYYEDVLDAGANLYLYTKGLVHSKTMTVDDSIALIGSSNFDIRSFEINFELSMLLYGDDVTQRLRQQQLKYLLDSRQLDAQTWRQRSSAKKLLENSFRLLSPIL